jgi:A/G-specific adenine glycosylase
MEYRKMSQIGVELSDWFTGNKRDFPWRHTEEPYEILIAELLLQRTRAENVVDVYNEFLKEYPSICDLSKANIERIQEIIAPLGLKKRADFIKNISVRIIRDYEGYIPHSKEELLDIKGIGYYIAYAILCFAYGEKVAVVDWNVARVIGRIWNYKVKSSPHSNKKFISFAQELLPETDPKKYNWSVLDFASLVCKPRNPDCENCPITHLCEYYKTSQK